MPLSARIAIAVATCLVIYLIAVKLVQVMLTPPPPDEPDLSTLRPVDYRYRCMVCGTEVTMTAAPDADAPTPPRHCREDMDTVAVSPSPPS